MAWKTSFPILQRLQLWTRNFHFLSSLFSPKIVIMEKKEFSFLFKPLTLKPIGVWPCRLNRLRYGLPDLNKVELRVKCFRYQAQLIEYWDWKKGYNTLWGLEWRFLPLILYGKQNTKSLGKIGAISHLISPPFFVFRRHNLQKKEKKISRRLKETVPGG